MKRILVSGYYGFGNAGDEAVLYALLRMLGEEIADSEVTALSADPSFTEKTYGVRAVNRWRIPVILREIKRCDILISGGGSLIQDVTGIISPFYYLGIMAAARFFRKPYAVFSQGVGPLRHEVSRKLAAAVFNGAAYISVRDGKSAELLKEIGVKRNVEITADPVFALESPAGEDSREKILGVALRDWGDGEKNAAVFAEALDILASEGWLVRFIPMHLPEDSAYCRLVADKMKKSAEIADKTETPEKAFREIKGCSMVLGVRLHAVIMAAAAGIPFLPVSYDPKVEACAVLLGSSFCLSIENISGTSLASAVSDIFAVRREQTALVAEKLTVLREKAKKPARSIRLLLDIEEKGK